MQSGSVGLIIGMAMKLTAAVQFLSCMLVALCLVLAWRASGQELAKRLILKDGSYQLASKWEVKGDRVRYFSAERGEWEEVPKSMVDWAATEKYAKDRDSGVPLPGAVELDKELAADRQAEEAKTPEVAPGLRLPQDGGVLLLDVFDNDPQLVELHQNSGEIIPDRKGNILRAAINPVASAKQNVELAGLHAKIQAHVVLPAIYIRLELPDQAANPSSAEGSPSARTLGPFSHRPHADKAGQTHCGRYQGRYLRQGQRGGEAHPDQRRATYRRLGEGDSVQSPCRRGSTRWSK